MVKRDLDFSNFVGGGRIGEQYLFKRTNILMPMDNLGREDKTDFETLKELFRCIGDKCYLRWTLPLISHSEEMGRLHDKVLQIYRQTEEQVAQLNSGDPRLRIVQDVDFKIGLEYRNGINQALEYLIKMEEGILREPRKVIL